MQFQTLHSHYLHHFHSIKDSRFILFSRFLILKFSKKTPFFSHVLSFVFFNIARNTNSFLRKSKSKMIDETILTQLDLWPSSWSRLTSDTPLIRDDKTAWNSGWRFVSRCFFANALIRTRNDWNGIFIYHSFVERIETDEWRKGWWQVSIEILRTHRITRGIIVVLGEIIALPTIIISALAIIIAGVAINSWPSGN